MESEVNKCLVFPTPVGMSWDVSRLHEDVLRHLANNLDFQSIRQFRLVCREWNAAGIAVLMKRGYYDLTYPCFGSERPNLYKGAIHYSSWKISHSVYESAEILHDNKMWQNLKSLTIHQKTPLTREFHRWAWETLESRCPNLQEITFIFEPISYLQPEREVYKDYKRAVNEKQNASFPKIANLRNLTSVTFQGIYDKTTAYFAQNLLQACSNLRHLYFCQLGEPPNVQLDVGAFRILDYLKHNPRLLNNLQSFGFSIRFNSADENEDEESVPTRILRNQLKFTKFVQREDCSSLQFNSENLTTLFWDSPYRRDDQLLPGVLTPSIAAYLVQLCLNGQLMNLDKRTNITLHPVKISFPDFPRLRALKLGFLACRSLSVPELVDCAPNLSVPELKGLEVEPWDTEYKMKSHHLSNSSSKRNLFKLN
jgi:hypothetical protein